MNNALNSRRLLLLLVLLLTLALVACERPLNEDEEPAATQEGPVVPEETQPDESAPAPGTEETAAPSTEEPAAPAGETTTPAEGGQSETSPEQPAPAPESGETTPTEPAPAEQPTVATPTESAPATQPGVEQTHVVQSGDNLFRIGLRYGCSVLELSTYNGIANPDWISIGQVIRIPATCGG